MARHSTCTQGYKDVRSAPGTLHSNPLFKKRKAALSGRERRLLANNVHHILRSSVKEIMCG